MRRRGKTRRRRAWSLEPGDKFAWFVHDAFDPLSFLMAAFYAGIDQAQNLDPTFGQRPEGYGKRFGADFAGQASWRFFTDFASGRLA